MVTKKGIKIVEFNARWGDPEAEVLVPAIKTDYLTIVEAVLNKKLNSIKITHLGCFVRCAQDAGDHPSLKKIHGGHGN